jgi:hypothetical protein
MYNAGICLHEQSQGAIVSNYENWIMGKKIKPTTSPKRKKCSANYSDAKFFPNLRTMNTGIHVLKLALA